MEKVKRVCESHDVGPCATIVGGSGSVTSHVTSTSSLKIAEIKRSNIYGQRQYDNIDDTHEVTKRRKIYVDPICPVTRYERMCCKELE